MTSSIQHTTSFDLEEFVVFLSAQLCGGPETTQALAETNDNRIHRLYWRSPILNSAVYDDSYVAAPHQSDALVYVDALFHFARTFCSVQFGGLILNADGAGGRDVSSGSLTLEDLRLLFEQFGYDLFLQENCQIPAMNIAKALNALQEHADDSDSSFFTCTDQTVSVTLSLGPTASAPLVLYRSDRGDSDRLNQRLVQRMIQKAVASTAFQSKTTTADVDHESEALDINQAILQWKKNKFSKAKASSAAVHVPSTALPHPTSSSTSPTSTTKPSPSAAKRKKATALANQPKMATIRKAPTRANKFSFAGTC
ncbi:hypothetical protein MPSEU_000831100 [Mayamaea pseudoterrestris]|nr:hypothetical protein MPSEU_000831100 [Mayamaea pseudoterrestris]